jgi:hypothetical protein
MSQSLTGWLRSTRLFGVSVITTLLACGGSDLTLPTDRSPTNLLAISGSNQEETVGSELPDPLIVRLTDAAARPIAGITVVFGSDVPGAKVEPASDETDEDGYASVRAQLGSTPGVQTFEARLDGGNPDLRATFGPRALARDQDDEGGGGGGRGRGGGGGGDDDD